MSVDWSLNTVQCALEILYLPGTTIEKRNEASLYLESWRKQPVAWTVSDQLIASGLQKQDYKLPSEAHESLRNSLLQHVMTLNNIPAAKAAFRYIGLCVAALAAQMISWEKAIGTLIDTFGQQADMIPALLMLLTAFPEEVSSERLPLTQKRRNALLYEMTHSSESVLLLLHNIILNSGDNMEAQKDVLLCAKAWIRWGSLDSTKMASNPLLPIVFQGLNFEFVFEDAVDIIVELLRVYHNVDKHGGLVSLLIENILSLHSNFVSIYTNDLDDSRLTGYIRIFAELGESYCQLLLIDETRNPSPDIATSWHVNYINLMVKCIGLHPSETSIIQILLPFWWRFCDIMKRSEISDSKLKLYYNSLLLLVDQCVILLQSHNIASDFTEREKIEYRSDIGDLIMDLVDLLDCFPVVNRLAQGLFQIINNGSFTNESGNMIEAYILALSNCCRSVLSYSDHAQVSDVTRNLLDNLPLIVETTVTACNNTSIWVAANILIGNFSIWVYSNDPDGSLIFKLYAFVVKSLGEVNGIGSSGAETLKRLCNDCCGVLSKQVGMIFELYSGCLSLPQRDLVKVIEGLCYVVSELSTADINNALLALMKPHFETLQAYLNALTTSSSGSLTPTSEQCEMVGDLIDRITTIIRYCRFRFDESTISGPSFAHPMIQVVVTSLWPLLLQCASVCKHSYFVVDKLCRLYKHALRSCQGRWEPLVDPFAKHILEAFTTYPHAPYIYASSFFTKEVARRREYIPGLINMYQTISQQCFTLLANATSMEERPYIVEEYFEYSGECMNVLSSHFFDSPILRDTVSRAIYGLLLQHHEAHHAAMYFMYKFLAHGVQEGGAHPIEYNNTGEDYFHVVIDIVHEFGENILNQCLRAIGGGTPLGRIQSEERATIVDIVYHLYLLPSREDISIMMRKSLSECIEDIIASPDLKDELTLDLAACARASDYNKFAATVFKFSKVCRLAAESVK